MTRIRFLLPLVPAALALSPAAVALDKACEPFVAAAEKSTEQPARHSVTELDAGTRVEAISLGGKFYLSLNGKWTPMKLDLLAAERKLNAEMRSGKIAITGCKALGKETVDGIATSVIAYTVTLAGAPPAAGKAYIGSDGLIHALSSDQQKVRYRYSGVKAPL